MIRRLLIACAVVATVERARALAVVEPACEHLAAFEALHPPGRVVAGAHEYYTSLCRGRPLLARVAGGLQLAATNATTRCDAASPCGFDVVGCAVAKPGRGGAAATTWMVRGALLGLRTGWVPHRSWDAARRASG